MIVSALMAALAVIFQIFPAFFSEIFVFVTMLSAVPIFISAKINFRLAPVVYLISGFLVMLVSPHEAMMFLFTNGVLGLALGIMSNLTDKLLLTAFISGSVLTIGLSILAFVIGVPIFGAELPGSVFLQISLIFIFAFFYSIIYFRLTNHIYKRLKKIF